MIDTYDVTKRRVPRFVTVVVLCVLTVIAFGVASVSSYRLLSMPPETFPVGEEIHVVEGLTVRDVSELLGERNVVRSSLLLYAVLIQEHSQTLVKAGTYIFTEPLTVHEVARALRDGSYQSPHVRVTLPEGFRARDIARYLAPITVNEVSAFEASEGYLFPDTYFVSDHMTAEDMHVLLRDTFTEKLAPYEDRMDDFWLSPRDIIILASIIEREAKDDESKHMVSGVLQNRLKSGMPLQVDASFDYLLGKESAELTEEDLAFDSPYNTYTHTGLPPTPISNPGLASIEAVLDPTPTEYFYYLTGDNGTFHYAQTFEEHKRNKDKYLR